MKRKGRSNDTRLRPWRPRTAFERVVVAFARFACRVAWKGSFNDRDARLFVRHDSAYMDAMKQLSGEMGGGKYVDEDALLAAASVLPGLKSTLTALAARLRSPAMTITSERAAPHIVAFLNHIEALAEHAGIVAHSISKHAEPESSSSPEP